MRVVVPLAGPDFVGPDGRVKSEELVEGQPLLVRTLQSRPWWSAGRVTSNDMIFVLRLNESTLRFANERLQTWFPGSQIVWLSRYTGGAALSAAAGIALAGHERVPLCVDLADILFDARVDPLQVFVESEAIGGMALTFRSESPTYSYLDLDDQGYVTNAAEKRVISANASAGVYFFRSPAVYFQALAQNLASANAVTHNGLYYVCPVLGGVIANGLKVVIRDVESVVDIKMLRRG